MFYYIGIIPCSPSLTHHGILGQKWGKKNGPPYPLHGGDYSKSEKQEIYKARFKKNSIYNKKHFDQVITKGTSLSTLSYDKDRTKNSDMFYAAYDKFDKHQYNAWFNKPISTTVYDQDNSKKSKFYKWRINNTALKDMKVASEDSAAKAFKNLYKKDRDFYNFVTDPNRMQSHFVESKYKFKGYKEARAALEKLRSGKEMTEDDVQVIYRMFNYVIPSDGGGNSKRAKDVSNQRSKFFKSLSESGYGAVLDTNDAIYGGFKANAPVIVFDTSNVLQESVYQTKMSDVVKSEVITLVRKALQL